MTGRPNILCIMSDEHDAAVMGCYGDPLVRTPSLDRLSRDGITFDACYCNSPLCVPSRLSFTAGKYIHRISAWSNSTKLPSNDYPSLPRLLRNAGYEPYLCGKQHYDAAHRYGFDDLLPEHNRSRMSGRDYPRRGADDWTVCEDGQLSWAKRAREFNAADSSHVMKHDREVTATATAFLRNRARAAPPFFLFAGYLAPHFPLIAPREIYERYRGRVPMPEIPAGLLESQPTNIRHLQHGFGTVDVDPETVRTGRELYWALVDWFDGQVGMLLETLSQTVHADNTVVIYTSDHGENKGDHGLWWKNNHYEHASRVPLIVSWPARWAGGQRRSQVCSLVDLVQTIAALADTACPDDWDGDSLLPLLDEPAAVWKDFAVSQYYGHNIASGMNMLRKGRYKYIYHNRIDDTHGPERELYDMESDPKEFVNLAPQSAYQELIAAMHAELVEELSEDPDAIELRCREENQRGYDSVLHT
jgi:choline-sulfatase